jgi:hypothetical protein
MCALSTPARSRRPSSFKHLTCCDALEYRVDPITAYGSDTITLGLDHIIIAGGKSSPYAMGMLRSCRDSGLICACMCLAGLRHDCYDCVLCTSCPLGCDCQLIPHFVSTVTLSTTVGLEALRNRAKGSRIDKRLNCRDLGALRTIDMRLMAQYYSSRCFHQEFTDGFRVYTMLFRTSQAAWPTWWGALRFDPREHIHRMYM